MKLYQIKDLTAMMGVSRSTIYRWVALGTLPTPFHIGTRSPRWRAETIDSWLDARR